MVKKIWVFGFVLTFLVACSNPLSTTETANANNQFRLHGIIWDINLPTDWQRVGAPLDVTMDVPFFATDEVTNIVVLPGSGLNDTIIDRYVENGKNKFAEFELLDKTATTLRFNGSLTEGADVTVFDQRIFRWDDESDLFLIYSCNYPIDFSGDDGCGGIFDTIKKTNRQTSDKQ